MYWHGTLTVMSNMPKIFDCLDTKKYIKLQIVRNTATFLLNNKSGKIDEKHITYSQMTK